MKYAIWALLYAATVLISYIIGRDAYLLLVGALIGYLNNIRTYSAKLRNASRGHVDTCDRCNAIQNLINTQQARLDRHLIDHKEIAKW